MAKVRYLGAHIDDETHQQQYAVIMCPACKFEHIMGIDTYAHGAKWTYNGDKDAPVFSPSLLLQSQTWVPPVTAENLAEWRKNPWEQKQVPFVCHSFVGCNGAQPGQIIFLSDCTHEMAGQVVDLPDITP